MGASTKAKPIGTSRWKTKDGAPVTSERIERMKVRCQGCRWRGHVGELLGEDDESTLWCPQCGGATWVYD